MPALPVSACGPSRAPAHSTHSCRYSGPLACVFLLPKLQLDQYREMIAGVLPALRIRDDLGGRGLGFAFDQDPVDALPSLGRASEIVERVQVSVLSLLGGVPGVRKSGLIDKNVVGRVGFGDRVEITCQDDGQVGLQVFHASLDQSRALFPRQLDFVVQQVFVSLFLQNTVETLRMIRRCRIGELKGTIKVHSVVGVDSLPVDQVCGRLYAVTAAGFAKRFPTEVTIHHLHLAGEIFRDGGLTWGGYQSELVGRGGTVGLSVIHHQTESQCHRRVGWYGDEARCGRRGICQLHWRAAHLRPQETKGAPVGTETAGAIEDHRIEIADIEQTAGAGNSDGRLVGRIGGPAKENRRPCAGLVAVG